MKALPDTADTDHYFHSDAPTHCPHIMRTMSDPTGQFSNGNVIKPNLQATLKIPNKLSPKVQCAHVFNDINTGSLISTGQLCDDY